MDEELDLDMQNEQGVAVVCFKARSISDYGGIAVATDKINKFVDGSKPRAVIFDFEQVKFFSSAVLGLLIAVRAKLKESKGEVVISAIDPQLHRVFKITNLEKIFRFFPNKTAAKEALN